MKHLSIGFLPEGIRRPLKMELAANIILQPDRALHVDKYDF